MFNLRKAQFVGYLSAKLVDQTQCQALPMADVYCKVISCIKGERLLYDRLGRLFY